nr:retrovirus-related Pol polyprotein from transposon TNT 1-94 [Tanacetum cinerariifolium]
MIQGLPNDIYSLIDSNKTAKDLWDALARHMLGSGYGEQDWKAAVLYEYETFKATEGELLLDTYIRYLQVIKDLKKCGYSKDNYINIDALYNILKQNQGDVNDAMGSKKKNIVITSDPLALIAEKTKVSQSKEKVVVSSAFNRRKFYSKPTNNNLRTSSTSQSANKKQKFVKNDNKKVEKKDDEKKQDMSRVKCYNCKKEGHFAKDYKKFKVKDYEYYKTKMLLAKKDKDEQVLLDEDQAWMESSSDLDKEINANTVFMAQIEKVLFDSEASSSSADEKIYEKTQVNLQLQVQRVRTDNGTEFKNKTLAKFFDEVGITQQFSVARTPKQNGVVERRNRTLVEAARTMLTFGNLPSFLWAEAIATACFTQNRLIIHKRFDKTPYELINKRKPNIKFFRVFGCRCYVLNDYEDVGKLKAKGDIRVFVGYSKESAAFRIYNKQTRKIHESVNVNFDELSEMASKQFSLEPDLSNLNEMRKFSNLLG